MPPVDHHINGREYWLSLAHRDASGEFAEQASKEFADYDPQELLGMSRRRFVQLMGGAMALSGLTLTGCRRYPQERLAPYARGDVNRVPGTREQYATVIELAGVSTGLLVSSFDGRPIKIEGNPSHPFSLGATDAKMQASVLDLYDPDRSRNPIDRTSGEPRTSSWRQFEAFAAEHFKSLRETGGDGLALLCEATASPTVLDMRARLKRAFPAVTWYEYEPISRDNQIEAARLAFGRALRPQLHLHRADLIVSFDADLFGRHPAALRYARDWAAGRRTADEGRMNRLLAVESTFTTTGGVADERITARPGSIEQMIIALAAAFNIQGAPAGVSLSAAQQAFVDKVAQQLHTHGRQSIITGGANLPPPALAWVHRINHAVGAVGHTVTFTEEPDADRPSHTDAIAKLTDAMAAGRVQTLIMLGGNPAYNAPADVPFADALPKVPVTLHLSHMVNETSLAATWHLPRAHYLETWGDGRAWDGTLSIAQPLIHPLYEGKSVAELLALVSNDELRDGYALVRRTFTPLLPPANAEKAWRRALHDGVVDDRAWPTVQPQLAATLPPLPTTHDEQPNQFDIVFTPDAKLYDGRFANNGWLQETPDSMTKVTWDNPALINQADADRLGLTTGDMVTLTIAGRSLDLPLYVMPGQAPGVIALSLDYGREAAGHVGRDVGFNTYTLRAADQLHVAYGATIKGTGRTYKLAVTQDHQIIDMVGRAAYEQRVGKPGESGMIIREAALEQYNEDRQLFHRDAHGNVHLQLFDQPHEFNDPHAWGMAVDMNSCIGCNACVVACQAENNIPVVGKDEVLRGREMHWLRIDRYFKGEPAGETPPQVVHQPMICVHCENAPCEQVCPVAATVHDTEGLNTMVYNRCIGTRYCSNNCPYKVRRFNYFDYHSKDARGAAKPWLGMPDAQQPNVVDQIKRMVYNPDVTVRMRGVMEKCNYCTQRITAAKIERRNRGEQVQDGDVVTACQQACPTQAIVFGNLNDQNSRVRKLQASHRAYGVLEELNVRPRTKYLARIRNPLSDQKS